MRAAAAQWNAEMVRTRLSRWCLHVEKDGIFILFDCENGICAKVIDTIEPQD